MSDEIKDKTPVENPSPTEAVPVSAEAPAKTTTTKKGKAEGAPKAKAQSKGAPKEKTGGAEALRAVGLAACKRHSLSVVWVTDDGQCFSQENDARSHGRNLANKEPLKVEA